MRWTVLHIGLAYRRSTVLARADGFSVVSSMGLRNPDGSERAVKDAQDVANASYTQEGRRDTMLVKSELRRKFPKMSKCSLKCINTE